MSCTCESHTKHICYLKSKGLDDCIAAVTDNPKVECRQCGAHANSAEYLCAAHLKQDAPNVEGGHGIVGIEEIGKQHAG